MWNMRQFFRMSKWARNPPGERQVRLFLIVIAACLILFWVERFVGWPDWLTMEDGPRERISR